MQLSIPHTSLLNVPKLIPVSQPSRSTLYLVVPDYKSPGWSLMQGYGSNIVYDIQNLVSRASFCLCSSTNVPNPGFIFSGTLAGVGTKLFDILKIVGRVNGGRIGVVRRVQSTREITWTERIWRTAGNEWMPKEYSSSIQRKKVLHIGIHQ